MTHRRTLSAWTTKTAPCGRRSSPCARAKSPTTTPSVPGSTSGFSVATVSGRATPAGPFSSRCGARTGGCGRSTRWTSAGARTIGLACGAGSSTSDPRSPNPTTTRGVTGSTSSSSRAQRGGRVTAARSSGSRSSGWRWNRSDSGPRRTDRFLLTDIARDGAENEVRKWKRRIVKIGAKE